MCRTASEYIKRMLEFRDEEKHDAEMEALHNDTEAACGDLYESL